MSDGTPYASAVTLVPWLGAAVLLIVGLLFELPSESGD